MSRVLHVDSKTGNDGNGGTPSAPFKTINAAARAAQPGDTVLVHGGTYREWVRPVHGGESDAKRIVFQAADGEEAVIKGSEIVDHWERVENGVWKVTLPDSMFTDGNPFKTKVLGDWFKDLGRDHHTADVYLNGESLFEVTDIAKVKNPEVWEKAHNPDQSLYTWYGEAGTGSTTIWANFHDYNPNDELTEANVRPACFYPEKTGINYITVRGFRLCQAATQWAPPTAEQMGLIGPHWAKGWIIENNIIHDSRCTGISLGKEKSTGDNRWTKERRKHGTQHERDVIFNALHLAGWNKENIGSHIVRNNTIYHCEQAGICGHLGCIFSEVTGNFIHDVYIKRQFYGYEIGGIKFHAAIDTLIQHNYIKNCTRGMWMDWQAQGTRISGNILCDNKSEDLFFEVNHGPYVVDNNICLSPMSLRNISQGGAFAHNLFCGKVVMDSEHGRYTQYHFPHSTAVAGLMSILSGDDRFYNNMFAPPKCVIADNTELADAGDITFNNAADKRPLGLVAYNHCPDCWDPWVGITQSPSGYCSLPLPVYIGSNYYTNGAQPYVHEANAVVDTTVDPLVRLGNENGRLRLHITVPESIKETKCPMVTTSLLGLSHETEAPYENGDGSELRIDYDIVGNKRRGAIVPGPFADLTPGTLVLDITSVVAG